jgi:hypothetical protein
MNDKQGAFTMKKISTITLFLVILLLAACGGNTPADTANDAPASALNLDYANALPLRNQLALGTLRLEDNPAVSVTPEQATQLLPLWQALRNLTGSGTSATAEVNALLAQIEGELTAEQLDAINAMALTQADIQAVAQEWGISGSNGGQPGAGAGLSDEEKAARQATRQASGESSGGVSVALQERLVQLLQERAK